MIVVSGADFKEKQLVREVEKAVFHELSQDNFFEIDLTVASEDEIKELNKAQRGIDKVTDVLSFPSFDKLCLPVQESDFSAADFDGKRVFLGSIMICRQRAKEQAEEFNHSYRRELGFLTCHGILHLLGFDHIDPDDEEVMTAHQRKIMEKVRLK